MNKFVNAGPILCNGSTGGHGSKIPFAPMITNEQAAEHLRATIADGARHRYYERTVELAVKYMRLITGEGIDKILHQFVERESAKQFETRKKFLFPIPPSVCHRAKVPLTKVPKADGLVDRVAYTGEGSDERNKSLQDALDNFYGDENLDDYMSDRFLDLNMQDPNAYVITEFDAFDPDREKAKPYPLEVSSAECVNKGLENNTTKWIIGRFPWTYVERVENGKEIKMMGERYVMYFGYIWDLRQVKHDDSHPKALNPTLKQQFVNFNGKSFEAILKNPFSDRQKPEFQGICVGHIKDPKTKGETYVSVIHSAVPRMLKTLKADSENTLIMALLAHPEVFEYDSKVCPGDPEHGYSCMDGQCHETGEACTVCGGTGNKPHSTTALEGKRFDLPPNPTREDLIPLSELKYFHSPGTDIPTMLTKYLADLEDQCLRDIFASVSLDAQPDFSTATKVNIDEEAQNNVIYPYGRKWATVKIKLVRMCAMFVDADQGLEYQCIAPRQLRLAPLGALVEELGKANNSGADRFTVQGLDRDIAAKKYAEQPLQLRMYEVRRRFRPLQGVSKEERSIALNEGLITLADKVLMVHEDAIYRNLNLIQGFWDLAPEQQKILIDREVQQLIDQIKADKATNVDFSGEMEKEKAKMRAA